MPQLTVHLNGVCVHVGPKSGLPGFKHHRAVYPAGTTAVDGCPVANHFPVLTGIENPPSIVNSTVTFSTSGATSPNFDGTMCCAPHLQAFFPWFKLDVDRVVNKQLEDGAYIDFTVGEIHGTQIDGAACTKVVIDYDDSTTSTEMTVTPFLQSDPPHTHTIDLPATITIDAEAHEHHLRDFYLTFKLAEQGDMPPPGIVAGQVGEVIHFVNVCLGGEGDAGCSNTQFP